MAKYRVSLETVASMTMTVEADDEEAAIEAAIDERAGICAQCSGWGRDYSLDLGEWDVPRADDGKGDADWAVEEITS